MKYLLYAVIAFLAFVVVRQVRAASKLEPISPTEAAQKVEKEVAVLIDVREPNEWAQGVAEPAKLLSLSDLQGDRKNWKPFLEALEPGTPLLLYCRSGNRSGIAGSILAKEGFTVRNAGGFSDWQRAGLPTRKP
jgi:rhodanese-related sulfurtransferase